MAVANGFNTCVFPVLTCWEHIDKNKGFLNVMALIVAIQVLLTYVGGRILRTTPLNLHEWSVVVLFSVCRSLLTCSPAKAFAKCWRKIKPTPKQRL